MTLKELRLKCNLTQKEAADFLNTPLRTYHRYETEEKYICSMKYKAMITLLQQKCIIDETHGVLTIDEIRDGIEKVFAGKPIKSCYLFGSYAKGKATEVSDVDLLVDTDITGFEYYGLLQKTSEILHKKIDLVRMSDSLNNPKFIGEVLKDGIKVYG